MIFGDSGNILVAEQTGRVWYLRQEHLSGGDIFVLEAVDLRDRVSRRGSEEGLLGLALDPNDERHLYVYYSAANPRRSVVSRFNYGSRMRLQPRAKLPTRPPSWSSSRSGSPTPTTMADRSPSVPMATSTSVWATAGPPATLLAAARTPRRSSAPSCG